MNLAMLWVDAWAGLLVVIPLLCVFLTCILKSNGRKEGPTVADISTSKANHAKHVQDQPTLDESRNELSELNVLFHQLHNLERFAKVLPHARETLLRLLSESLEAASALATGNILAIKQYDERTLVQFINGINDRYCEAWNDYIVRREAGGPREMFKTETHAVAWLVEQAPVKLVDGAWLGHLHRFSAAFDTRTVTKDAWQVMSEEIGDGDLAKNHAHLYQKLLSDLGIEIPNAADRAFIDPRQGFVDVGAWRLALAQLLISLFPNDFMPEILGFNLHFELLTWETLCATKELREFGIDDYYFVLHVSIDNAHSGHAAMSTRIVTDYMSHISRTNDPTTVQQIWRRIQAGYALSHCVSLSKEPTIILNDGVNSWNAFAEEVLRIFQHKAMVSQNLHCTSKARVGGRRLTEWLDPSAMRSVQHAREFIEALSRSRSWVIPGDSSRSRLIQAMSWEGRMFGAFSNTEVKVVCSWINQLSVPEATVQQRTYWTFTGREVSTLSSLDPAQQDILMDYPVFDPTMDRVLKQWLSSQSGKSLPSDEVANLSGTPHLDRLLPLWFAQVALLEAMITVPINTCNVKTSALVRIVRAQRGFQHSGDGCAGMDEVRRCDEPTSLHDLGLTLMSAAGRPPPKDLREVFDGCDHVPTAAINLLHMSMRPLQYEAALVGMSWALAGVRRKLVATDWPELSAAQRNQLKAISEVELSGLRAWWGEASDASTRKMWAQGYEAMLEALKPCFQDD